MFVSFLSAKHNLNFAHIYLAMRRTFLPCFCSSHSIRERPSQQCSITSWSDMLDILTCRTTKDGGEAELFSFTFLRNFGCVSL